MHRVRQGFVKARTAQGNQIRSLLGEFGTDYRSGSVSAEGSEALAEYVLTAETALMPPLSLPR